MGEIRPVRIEDIPKVAEVFKRAFPMSVQHVYGTRDSPMEGFIDIFTLLAREEPENFLVYDESGVVAGYIVAPANMFRLWVKAVLKGYVFLWLIRWMMGRYEIPVLRVLSLVQNKMLFARSSYANLRRGDAQILSVAVDPDYHGRGIGKMLTSAAMNLLKKQGARIVKLEVRPDNEPAKRIYRSMGFVPAGYSRDSQGLWLVMEAVLGSE